MARVAVLDDYQGVALEMADWSTLAPDCRVQVFRNHLTDRDALADRLRDFDIVTCMRERTPFRRDLMERLPNLRLLVTTGMRNAAIDVEADLGPGPPHPARGRRDAPRTLGHDGRHESREQGVGSSGPGPAGCQGCQGGRSLRDVGHRVEPEPDSRASRPVRGDVGHQGRTVCPLGYPHDPRPAE